LRILPVDDDAETSGYILQGPNEAAHNVAIAADVRDGLLRGAGED
jgi:hypothetical protein